MLRRLNEADLLALVNAGYEKEIRDEPLVDAASPTPHMRAQLFIEFQAEHHTAVFQGATPRYLALYKPVLFYVNSPFEPALLPYILKLTVRITSDHLNWARGLNFGRGFTKLIFSNCTLRVFLAAVAAWQAEAPVLIQRKVLHDDETIVLTQGLGWVFRPERAMVVEAFELAGTRALKEFYYSGNHEDRWVWHTHA